MPQLPQRHGRQSLSLVEEIEPDDWLAAPRGAVLSVQTLHQQNGFGISLLIAEPSDVEDPPELEDTFDRFLRFNLDREA